MNIRALALEENKFVLESRPLITHRITLKMPPPTKKMPQRNIPVASTDDRTKTGRRRMILSNCIFIKPKASMFLDSF